MAEPPIDATARATHDAAARVPAAPTVPTVPTVPRVRLHHHLTPFHWREALLATPAMPLLLVAGVAAGRPVQGVVAAGAAFAVGFGAARELRGRRWHAMLWATLGMAVAAFTGCLAGEVAPLHLMLAAALAAGCAALALHDEAMWWASLQTMIAFLVAAYYHGDLAAATIRAGAVLTGGAAQIALVRTLARLFPAAATPFLRGLPPHSDDPTRRWSHMARAALAVTGSLIAARALALPNSYWAPMTAIIVLKPRLLDSRVRGVARLGGTLSGCVLATGYAAAVADRPLLVLAGVTVVAAAAFALQRAHYVALSACITATVVLLLALGGADVVATDEHRILATLIGGVAALGFAAIVPHPLRRRWRRAP